MKLLLATVGLSTVALAACATTLEAQSDHDSAQNFSAYRTYAWMADEPLIAPVGQVTQVSPLNRHRIVTAIEENLGAKGFVKASERGKADFVVSYTVGARDRIDVQSYPEPYAGTWRWGWPYFGHDVDVRMYTEGTLSIDMFDGTSHQPVWHGWGSKRITEHDVKHAAEQIPPAVTQILQGFPPS